MEVACDRQALLAGCVAEAMRLRAPGVAVRMATADFDLPVAGKPHVHIAKVGYRTKVSTVTSKHGAIFLSVTHCRF